jgi:hypothetical protein
MADIRGAFDLDFEEQIAFFRSKINLPTERYDDIKKSAHDRAFIVAGAAKADLLFDLRNAVDKAVTQHASLEDFRSEFRDIVTRHGWTGWTGEGTSAGEAWRTRIIWDTNLRTSYAAGRWNQLTSPEVRLALPYWRYVHGGSNEPRPQHQHWGDIRLTLPVDHPFWQSHYPPNGWGCSCRVVGEAEIPDGAATSPPEGWDSLNSKTGAPDGIDKGWDYALGEHVDTSLRSMVQDKLITYPPAIARALGKDINRYIAVHEDVSAWVSNAIADKTVKNDLWLGFAPERVSASAKENLTDFLVLLPADNIRHIANEHFDDAVPPTPADFIHAMRWLDEGDITPGSATGKTQQPRIKCVWRDAGREIVSIWEVRSSNRNKALMLVTTYIKK